MTKFVFLLLSALLLGSCGFNRAFYHPDTNPVATTTEAESHYIRFGEKDSIHAFFYPNPAAKANLFILHGNAGNLNSWSEVADLFYQDNYQTFIIDYPGFGNSTGKATHKSVIESTDAAVKYFKNLPGIQQQKNIVMGFSLGGNLAVKVATDYPGFFDALVVEAPFDTQRSAAIYQVPRPFKFAPFLITKNEINGNKLIEKWIRPLLVIHSTDDKVCAYKMGKSLYDHAIYCDNKELWTIKGPHLAGLGMNFELYLAKMNKMVGLIPDKN